MYSGYVAELHNTWTSVAIVPIALLAMHSTRQHASRETRFVLAYASVGSVGVGSALFHGMLRRWGQVLDELPMILILFCVAFIAIEREKAPRYGAWFPAALALAAAAIVVLYLICNVYTVFLVGFVRHTAHMSAQ